MLARTGGWVLGALGYLAALGAAAGIGFALLFFREPGDVARELAAYAESVDHDPARLAAAEERRELLFRLRRKHGAATVAELVEGAAAMAEELAGLERSTRREGEVEGERASLRVELEELIKILRR